MNSVISFCAQYLYLVVILTIFIAWLREKRNLKLKFLVAVIIAGAIAFVLSRIASKLYYDPRPFVSQHVKPLFPHVPDNGFPSDHALLTGTLTAITYFFNKKVASIMLVLTIIIGVARVLAKVHSPLDIAAGWIFGIIGAVISYYLVSWYFNKKVKPAKRSEG
ncbi:MAG: phosphatase PAP2 family protein [Candidatus Saccharimonadales bacterium]